MSKKQEVVDSLLLAAKKPCTSDVITKYIKKENTKEKSLVFGWVNTMRYSFFCPIDRNERRSAILSILYS